MRGPTCGSSRRTWPGRSLAAGRRDGDTAARGTAVARPTDAAGTASGPARTAPGPGLRWRAGEQVTIIEKQ